MKTDHGSFQVVVSGRYASADDIRNARWLILGKALASAASTTTETEMPLVFVVASLLIGDEFRSELALIDGRLFISDAMLAPIDPALCEWLDRLSAPIPRGANQPLDRLTAVSVLIHDPGVRQATYAVNPAFREDTDALIGELLVFQDIAQVVAASTLFDADYYASQLSDAAAIANLAAHYVLRGEAGGLRPSADFDPEMYEGLHPDIGASGINRLFHYERHGRSEGRAYRSWLADHPMPPIAEDRGLPTILLLLHEATYTGAPILGWNLARELADQYNVVVVLRRGGALEPALRNVAAAFVAAPPASLIDDPQQMRAFAERLVVTYRPVYAIANSIETSPIAIAVRHTDTAVIALVHEFWPGAKPVARLEFYACCAALVFPAHIVEQSSLRAFREAGLQNRFIIPQGPSAVPRSEAAHGDRASLPFVDDLSISALGWSLEKDGSAPFTVIGLGAVDLRKGVDLFIATATALLAKHPDLDFRFLWVGTWRHAADTPYATFLMEQRERSRLEDRLRFLAEVDDLDPIYAQADAMLLSSRLDPLPNVAIDAALRGIPVICFEQGSGAAELLAAQSATSSLVVPYLDSGAAADRIARLARDGTYRASVGEAIRALAHHAFNMSAYATAIDDIGRGAARRMATVKTDLMLLETTDAFDASLYFGASDHGSLPGRGPAHRYLDQTVHINFALAPVPELSFRKPRAGFNPFVYGSEADAFPRDGSRDPLAHYVEHGMPIGRWTHRVLRPDGMSRNADPYCEHLLEDTRGSAPEHVSSSMRVALHGYVTSTESIDKLLHAMAANRTRADLFLTTTSTELAEWLQQIARANQARLVVAQVASRPGSDLTAFIEALLGHVGSSYELIGNITDVISNGAASGRDRCDQAWGHLLGPSYPMLDLVVSAMQADDRLGAVFAESATIVPSHEHVAPVAALARRLDLHDERPAWAEAPRAGMFWARMEPLRKLLDASGEVAAVGEDTATMTDLGMLLPALCEKEGYSYATTYIPEMVIE